MTVRFHRAKVGKEGRYKVCVLGRENRTKMTGGERWVLVSAQVIVRCGVAADSSGLMTGPWLCKWCPEALRCVPQGVVGAGEAAKTVLSVAFFLTPSETFREALWSSDS